jgi:hypothetical protein
MRKLAAALIVALSMAAGAVSAAARAVPTVMDGCPNTWCAPEDTVCYELTNWSCELSGGCVGTHKCNPEQ